MIQPKFSYRSIITFLLGLTISYFLFIPGIKFTKIKWLAIESINGILNQKLDHFFADTYLYLHTADQQPRQIVVGPYQLKLSPILLDSKYDTQLNLLNEKNILSQSKVSGEKLPVQNQKIQLSNWDLWLLPSILVFCLSIAVPILFIKRILLFLFSLLFLQIINLLRFLTILIIQINQSENLSPVSLSLWQNKLISYSTLFHGIESIYLITLVSWIFCLWIFLKANQLLSKK
ncbi:MAG: hypothetical protein JNK69_04870 [Saprospiraceae bacterium]|nr:hypothetical protein [Saprospiraceae bacterium]